jgi:4-amino-4-deoxy-L-arabinose transferase-like glycosyltransferase
MWSPRFGVGQNLAGFAVRPWWPWASVVIVLLASAAVRLRLLDVPLDRDEGEYAYIGSLLLDGIPPYARAYNMKMPGIYGVYAVMLAVFGHSAAGIHVGLAVVTSLSTVLVFLLGRRVFDARVGVAASVAFATLSLNPHLFGLAGYAEHFLLPAVLLAILLLVRAVDEDRPALVALAGMMFGVAFLVKQSGGAFASLGIAWVITQRLPDRRGAARDAALVIVGAVVPFALVCAALAALGTFENFWFWTVRYALEYGSVMTPSAAWRNLRQSTGQFLPASWPIVALAALAVALALGGRDLPLRQRRVFLMLFTLASAVGVSVGLYFRQQYFLLLAPAVALLAGAAPFAIVRGLPGRPGAASAFAASLVLLGPVNEAFAERTMLFQASPARFARTLYGYNPVSESIEIGRYIRERSATHDTIAVIGSEPQIYFYAGRPAATGYIYMYPLMEPQPFAAAMQQHMVTELTTLRPRFLVMVNVYISWLATPASDATLARWLQTQWGAFEQVGVADIVSDDLTRYRWDDAARDYRPESALWVAVFRRRD